jgi:diguanylate cyclase (GGDEF)-like protein/PAS domain S-box-containing protein
MTGRAVGWWAQTKQKIGQFSAVIPRSAAKPKPQVLAFTAFRHAIQAIFHSTSERELFEKICAAAVEQGGMTLAWVGVLDPLTRCIRPVASWGVGVEYLQDIPMSVDAEEPTGQCPTSAAFRQGQPFWCQNFQSDPTTAPWHDLGTCLSWASCAALPLRSQGAVTVVLSVYAGEPHAFDPPTRELLADMTSCAGYALENLARETALTLSLAQSEQARQKEDLRGLLMDWLSSDLSLEQVLENFVLEIEKRFPGARCSLLLLDRGGQHLVMGAAPSLPDFFIKAINGMPIGPHAGCCGAAVFSNQRVVVEDMSVNNDCVDFQVLAHQAGLVSCWSEPIRSSRQKVLGTFALYHGKPSTPSVEELEFMTMAARMAMLAIDRKRAELRNKLGNNVFEHLRDTVAITDSAGCLVRVNSAFTQITGYTTDETFGKNMSLLASGRHPPEFFNTMWSAISGEGQWQGEIWNRRKDGSIFPQQLSISALCNQIGTVVNYVAIGTDISQLKNNEERIRQLVKFDTLTGLPNLHSLTLFLADAMASEQSRDEPLTLMFLDLDRFKNVNDALGHQIGDALLVRLARCFKSMLRDVDTVYRLGGDKFAMVLPGLDAPDAAQFAIRALEVTAQGFAVEQHNLVTTLSIGIALYPRDGDTFETLSNSAETAMYEAKQAGRNTHRFFSAQMRLKATRALLLENGLRRALELKQMHLVYQPQVSLHDGQVIGMETLLRWEHPTLGTVSPAEFIPVAEDSGLILPIGEWVLRTATQQLRAWLDAGLALQLISVNLSVVQFRHVNLPGLIAQVLLDADLPAHYLELELTEGVAMDDPLKAIEVMDKLVQSGVRLSIDDFGTGYSSLSYLKRFSVHKLKIDQSFVHDITDDADDKAIVVAIIALARSMGFKTIAEGVETQGQLDFLREQGCDDVQGYFYSRPLLPAAFEAFVRQHQGTL